VPASASICQQVPTLAGMTHPDSVLSTNASAGYLGVSPRKLYDLRSSGQIVGIQISNVWRYRRSELDRFLDAHEVMVSA
jgi:hypothetical protein